MARLLVNDAAVASKRLRGGVVYDAAYDVRDARLPACERGLVHGLYDGRIAEKPHVLVSGEVDLRSVERKLCPEYAVRPRGGCLPDGVRPGGVLSSNELPRDHHVAAAREQHALRVLGGGIHEEHEPVLVRGGVGDGRLGRIPVDLAVREVGAVFAEVEVCLHLGYAEAPRCGLQAERRAALGWFRRGGLPILPSDRRETAARLVQRFQVLRLPRRAGGVDRERNRRYDLPHRIGRRRQRNGRRCGNSWYKLSLHVNDSFLTPRRSDRADTLRPFRREYLLPTGS